MKYDLVITEPIIASSKYHKWDKKCVGRFFTTDNALLSIDIKKMQLYKKSNFGNEEYYIEDFKTKRHQEQELIITSLCQKCCQDIINILLENSKPEAVKSANNWFDRNRKIKLLR